MRKVKAYGSYFFYFFQYSPLLAFQLLLDEIKGEKKYKLNTAGFDRVVASTAYSYMPSNYILLEELFTELNKYSHNGTFLDLGCGKGRAMMVAAHYNFKKIMGVELEKEYCNAIADSIPNIEKELSCKIDVICTDAGEYKIPNDVQTIFFYNPFKETVMEKVVQNLMESIINYNRPVFVIYLNPLFSSYFINAGFVKIYTASRYGELNGSIYYRG